VLTYHVVSGNVQAKDLQDGQVIKTVEGQSLTVRLVAGLVFINSAQVTTADVEASNGVVHIIDGVLLPRAGPSPPAPTPAPPAPAGKSIAAIAVATPDLSTLVTALTAADLVGTLSNPGPFTVFAPTNEAFAKLDPLFLKLLLDPKNVAVLQKVLTYHVVQGQIAFSKNLMNGEQIKTVEGNDVTVHIAKKLFSKTVMINDATVTTADVAASNGVVHIIDTVLLPPDMPAAGKTIVDLAVGTPELSTLVTALKAAGLVDTLSSAGPFTVFAPTNEAFAELPAGLLAKLLKPSNKPSLVALLTYHVIGGAAIKFDDLQKGVTTTAKSVEGDNLNVFRQCTSSKCSRASRGFINRIEGTSCDGNVPQAPCYQAQITVKDNEASNGVVHIISGVLSIPSNFVAALEE